MLCYSMSLRGYKGVQKSKFSKCSNWAETLLKVCVWHSNHDKTYAMLKACHKGVIKGFGSLNFQNAPIELKLDLKCACDIITMIKHYAML